MKQKRLEAICSYLSTKDKIIDVGCDHAYVCIEMAKRGSKIILASDIHENALQVAKENIQASGYSIECCCSDGLKQINTSSYDTLIIAGMGASTIIAILKEKAKLKPIQKIIIQSNNDLKQIRRFVSSIGYELKDETVIYEKKHYYTIMKFVRGSKKISKIEENLGIWKPENKDYYQFLWEHQKSISNKIPKRKWLLRYRIRKEQREIQKYLKYEKKIKQRKRVDSSK